VVESTPCTKSPVLTIQVAPLFRTVLSQCHVPRFGKRGSEVQNPLSPTNLFKRLNCTSGFPSSSEAGAHCSTIPCRPAR
jgi:hypothetical protein